MTTREQAEALVDEMVARADKSETAHKVEEQFERKLDRLAEGDKIGAETIDRLRVMWQMFHEPDEAVTWQQKALIMAALGYFVSPVDMIPDVAGKPGYMDDKMVVNIVWSRLGDAVKRYGG